MTTRAHSIILGLNILALLLIALMYADTHSGFAVSRWLGI
jgi:hypothetical protein